MNPSDDQPRDPKSTRFFSSPLALAGPSNQPTADLSPAANLKLLPDGLAGLIALIPFPDGTCALLIADRAGQSVCNLAHTFKTATGQAWCRYVFNCQIPRARHALARGRQRIANVVPAAGFGTQSYPTRRFRQEVGVASAVFAQETRTA